MIQVFYFLSKTDPRVIRDCPGSTKNIHATLGFFVLITGVMAFISGSYAISNMFIHEDPATGKPQLIANGWLYSMMLGAVYAVFIMAIDREIVSANTKWAAIVRLPLAVIISLIVSVPIELQIFEGKITKHLMAQHINENDSLLLKVTEQNDVPSIESDIKRLEIRKQEATENMNYWSKLANDEIVGRAKKNTTGLAGLGNAYRDDTTKMNFQEGEIKKIEAEIKEKNNKLEAANRGKDSGFVLGYNPQSYDLLSKYIALKEVKENDKTGSASTIGFGIMVLLCLFELIPSICKLLLPKTEYDALLDSRRRLNIHASKTIFRQSYSDYEGMEADEIVTNNQLIVDKIFNAQAI